MSTTFTEMMSDITKRVAEAQQKETLAQINDMIAEGILETQVLKPVFTATRDSVNGVIELEIRESIRVVSKHQALIDDLRAKNRVLALENEELTKGLLKACEKLATLKGTPEEVK